MPNFQYDPTGMQPGGFGGMEMAGAGMVPKLEGQDDDDDDDLTAEDVLGKHLISLQDFN